MYFYENKTDQMDEMKITEGLNVVYVMTEYFVYMRLA